MKNSDFVSIDKLSDEMSQEEYSATIERFHRLGYENDVERDENGVPIDGDEYVLRGMRVFNAAMLGG